MLHLEYVNQKKSHVVTFQELIENEEDLPLCGVILVKEHSRIREDTGFINTKEYLDNLISLLTWHAIFVPAAEIYWSLRKQNFTVRKPVDCKIAFVTIEYDIRMLHNDRDIDHIAKH